MSKQIAECWVGMLNQEIVMAKGREISIGLTAPLYNVIERYGVQHALVGYDFEKVVIIPGEGYGYRIEPNISRAGIL